MTLFADFAKTSIKAQQTELKTLQYELKRCMNSQLQIVTLNSEVNDTTGEPAKNEHIELIPRLPIQFKVSLKEKVAPLRLKFEFYDSSEHSTRKRLKNPDSLVCVSQTVPNPTVENCEIAKTDFKNPYIKLFDRVELHGKTFPEFEPQNKNLRFPQQVYLSLQSMTGCYCTITVSFPLEKKAVLNKQTRQPVQNVKIGTNHQMSKQAEHFMEYVEIEEDEAIKHQARERYKRKKKFIKEEI